MRYSSLIDMYAHCVGGQAEAGARVQRDAQIVSRKAYPLERADDGPQPIWGVREIYRPFWADEARIRCGGRGNILARSPLVHKNIELESCTHR